MRRLLALWSVALAAACGRESVPGAALVDCGDGGAGVCGQVVVDFGAGERTRLLGRSVPEIQDAWRIDYGGGRIGPATGVPAARPQSNGRVLVLVDVSGSMKGSKIGAARLVLRQVLGALDSVSEGRITVAVAPFGSREVAERIGRAQFRAAGSAAEAVDALPMPATENTALYSAVVLASHRLRDELRSAGSGTTGALVVITDGNNDVAPGDDPGLLAGEAGLAAAARATDGVDGSVGIIGIGDLDRAALDRLAGPRGRVFALGANPTPLDLAEPLGRILTVFQSRWLVRFRHQASNRWDLARRPARFGVGLELDGRVAQVTETSWRPPLIATPAFAAGSTHRSGGPPLGALLIGVVLAVIMAELWVMIPRLLFGRSPGAGQGASIAGAAMPSQRTTADFSSTIRRDSREAPPRKLSDVTASSARRDDR